MYTKKFLFSLIVVLMVAINYTNVVMLGGPSRYNFVDSYIPLTLSFYLIISSLIFLILSIINVETSDTKDESFWKIVSKMLIYYIVFMAVFLVSTVFEISFHYQNITNHNLIVDVLKYVWSGIVLEIALGILSLSIIEGIKGYYLEHKLEA